MQIVERRVWNDFEFIWLIIKERLDPWSIFKNSKVYASYHNDELVSFCTVKAWGINIELGTVATKKVYRGKGFASKVIKYFLKKHKKAYVTCPDYLEKFYNKFGFKRIAKAPYPIYQRIKIANFFAGLIGKKYIIMKN